MSFRSVAIPCLGGGLLVLGYAAYKWNWLRARRTIREHTDPAGRSRDPHEKTEPLSASLEHVPDELALDCESQSLPANNNGSHSAERGALFLGRATAALSAVHFSPHWPEVTR